jgi:predicted RNA binding protein YcfA (HicA-like mRNA interferase family)
MHPGKPIKPGTLRSILNQARFSEEQLEALL